MRYLTVLLLLLTAIFAFSRQSADAASGNPADHGTVTIENGAGTGPLYGGNMSSYLVVLSSPAPAGGDTFNVVSGDPTALSVDNPVDIPAGEESGGFSVETANVTSAVHTSLSATVDGQHASVPVTIEPNLFSFTNFPTAVTGGDSFTMTLNMFGPVDRPTVVDVFSLIGIAATPPTVTVPKGSSSVSFTVTTVSVTAPEQIAIEADVVQGSGNVAGEIQSSNITLNP